MATQDAQKGSQVVHHLACHCQAHVLAVTLPGASALEAFTDNGVCDCSHCLKRRTVWFSAPKGSIKVIRGFGISGDAKPSEYRFASKSAAHQFCGTCGTQLLGDTLDVEKESTMLNLRAIRDPNFILWDLPLTVYKGADRGAPYVHPTLSDIPGAAEYLAEQAKGVDSPRTIVVGACHCQAIKFAALVEPLETVELGDCSCSICLGNGDIWLYCPRNHVFYYPSASPATPYLPKESLLIEYSFGKRENAHVMCKACGLQIYEYAARPVEDPRPAGAAAKSPWVPENGYNGSFGFNIALLNNAGDFFDDVHGIGPDGKTQLGVSMGVGIKLRGLFRDVEWKDKEPKYELRL